ncbi:hypothetical protein GGR50DRAFT_684208 [Xylaria sp. CBS 124048]|nr:hypothetical protein GGR50DRAFT_684208 [Xylaria sp. CBS 124048]
MYGKTKEDQDQCYGTELDADVIASLTMKVMGEDVTLSSSESELPLFSNRTALETILGDPSERIYGGAGIGRRRA